MKFNLMSFALAAAGLLAVNTYAAPQDSGSTARQELTAVGAEKAGNADSTIPAFSGSEKSPAGWEWGKPRINYWKYRDEKPLFVIDSSNVDKYADKLSQGQIELLKRVKGYSMPIYASHRDCGLPEFVTRNTKIEAGKASIGKDGWSLSNAVLPGVPFPEPKAGIEVVWNWLMRYQSAGAEWLDGYDYVSPRPGSTEPITVRFHQIYYYPWAEEGQHSPQDNSGMLYGNYYAYTDPAALAGQGVVQRFYFDKDTESYYYFTGQRRVRRLPSYAYDAPLIGYENQYPADAAFIFSGNPDRFDWKLVGKKEIYIPYNNFAMQDFSGKLSDATGPNALNPRVRRYELHRVWVVEGTVKSGMRHSTPHKTLYVDEDSWLLAVGDDYDAQGKIWKEKENFIAPQWEIQACVPIADVFNDMISGRYLLDQTVVGTGKDIRFFPAGLADPRLSDDYYTGQNLGAISER